MECQRGISVTDSSRHAGLSSLFLPIGGGIYKIHEKNSIDGEQHERLIQAEEADVAHTDKPLL